MKRFYKLAEIAECESGFRITLDGRAVKTQLGGAQIVPSRALAQLLASEWNAQGEELDPHSFPFRDLADYAIDIAGAQQGDTIANLLKYAGTDTLCYRAEEGDALFRRQQEMWEPLVAEAEAKLGVQFRRISGIIHAPQPEEALQAVEAYLRGLNAFTLSALYTASSLAASLIIGLAAIAPDADAVELWNAANLEEDWQAELWGKDSEALELRARRLESFTKACEFAAALKI